MRALYIPKRTHNNLLVNKLPSPKVSSSARMAQRSLVEEATRPLVLITVSVLLGFLCYLYYRFVHSPYLVFAGTGVKGPNPRILLGNSLELLTRGEMQTYHKFYKTYGPIFGFYRGTRPVVAVTDPILVDMVLSSEQNSFTTVHHNHQHYLRSILRVHGLPAVLSPLPQQQQQQQQQRFENDDTLKARKGLRSILLLPRLFKLMVPVVLQNFDTLLLETLESSLSRPSVDIWSVYEPYCLQVILGIVGLSSGKHREEVASALQNYFTVVNRSGTVEFVFRALFGSIPCFDEAMKVLNRRAKAEEEFDNLVGVVSSAICEAKQYHQVTGIKRNYLQVLLDQSLPEDQTVSYTLLILLLGYHSILTTLSAATVHLAADPITQQKLYSELSTSVQRETLFYEAVDSVEFLDAVVQETLRLCSLTPKLVKINRLENRNNTQTTAISSGAITTNQCAEAGVHEVSGICLASQTPQLPPLFVHTFHAFLLVLGANACTLEQQLFTAKA
ncbi:Cytochrome P450 3A12 [Geodia barretti]|uniref:Cytochrome P450 3A12 n=1 Tax=Geodia barretti TaxID=519541 RepID=A0AA35RDX3_GEOBA|nr:Cytochrome P450 3A12 [Geodia barretti]